MSAKPVYRYPPKSHAPGCPCDRCVQCRNRPSGSDGLLAFDFWCLAILLTIIGVSSLCGWLIKEARRLPMVTAETWWTIGIGAVAVVLIVAVARASSTKTVRPPKGRLNVEATPQPVPRLPVDHAYIAQMEQDTYGEAFDPEGIATLAAAARQQAAIRRMRAPYNLPDKAFLQWWNAAQVWDNPREGGSR